MNGRPWKGIIIHFIREITFKICSWNEFKCARGEMVDYRVCYVRLCKATDCLPSHAPPTPPVCALIQSHSQAATAASSRDGDESPRGASNGDAETDFRIKFITLRQNIVLCGASSPPPTPPTLPLYEDNQIGCCSCHYSYCWINLFHSGGLV